ncbi:MAG: inorganic phosphate transporter [Elusimicrobia bacterium]|nr:inorganic phosphate transporter [Elusimicrobiota bacterium]
MKIILVAMFIAPLCGFLLTYLFTRVTFFLTQVATPQANRLFRGFQIVSLLAQSLAHGSNDAQKAMGIIALSLTFLYGNTGERGVWLPNWTIVSTALSLALGVSIGGWRVIKRLGYSLYVVRPIHSFASQFSSGTVLLSASALGIPLSTTHVIFSSSVLGAGAAFRPKAVRWTIAGEFVLTWLITIPVTAILSASLCRILKGVLVP